MLHFSFHLAFPSISTGNYKWERWWLQKNISQLLSWYKSVTPPVFNGAMQLYTIDSAPTVLLKCVPPYKELCFLQW